jgi:hypothetical protein
MNVNIDVNDYAIVQLDDKKKHLIKVLKVPGDQTNGAGVLIASLPYEPENLTFSDDDVVCNLGPRPEIGKAYGLKIEPFIRTVSISTWGEIHYFDRLSKKVRKEIQIQFTKAYRTLEKKKLIGFFPLKTEIRPKAGKYAGSYKYNGKDKEDVFTLHPKEWTDIPYVVMHECGHGVWFRMLTNKQRAEWIRFYHTIVTHKEVKPETLSKLRRKLVKGEDTINQFSKQLDEEVRPVFAQCLKFIHEKHNLNAKHLDTVLEEGDDLKEFWPTSVLELKELKTDITEYATKSPEEFFAEAFAYHLIGKKLPKYIATRLDNTLAKVA